jgi:ribosome-binding protein aMBF1 (putative translation factor)
MKHETPDKHPCEVCRRKAKVSPVTIETGQGRRIILVCRGCKRELGRWQQKQDVKGQQP